MFNDTLNAVRTPFNIRTLPAMLEWQATANPKGLAVVSKYESLTNADLFVVSHKLKMVTHRMEAGKDE